MILFRMGAPLKNYIWPSPQETVMVSASPVFLSTLGSMSDFAAIMMESL